LDYHNSCDIPLKLFYSIINTGDLRLLIIDEKKPVTEVQLSEAWHSIMKEYAEVDKNVILKEVNGKNDELFRLACEQAEVKAILLYLVGAHKQEYIDRLIELGYPIDVSNFEAKKKSIVKCDKRANHIKTRMQLIHKSIEDLTKADQENSFDATISWLAINLKFEPRDDISVRRYLEYKKQIIERNNKNRKKPKPVEA
jgi:hypothetical protein